MEGGHDVFVPVEGVLVEEGDLAEELEMVELGKQFLEFFEFSDRFGDSVFENVFGILF